MARRCWVTALSRKAGWAKYVMTDARIAGMSGPSRANKSIAVLNDPCLPFREGLKL